MGSTFTKEKTAEILGVSIRTVYDYLRKGWLKEIKDDDILGIPQQEVFELKMCFDDGIKFMPVNPITLAKLNMKIRLLEAKLEMVMRVFNLRHDPLELTDAEILHHYDAAQQFIKEGWSPQMEEAWINFFLRLKEKDLEQLERITKEENPWRPFHRLAVMMESTPFDKGLKDELRLALDNVRMLSSIWLESKGGGGPKALDRIIAKDSVNGRKTLKAMTKAREQGKST